MTGTCLAQDQVKHFPYTKNEHNETRYSILSDSKSLLLDVPIFYVHFHDLLDKQIKVILYLTTARQQVNAFTICVVLINHFDNRFLHSTYHKKPIWHLPDRQTSQRSYAAKSETDINCNFNKLGVRFALLLAGKLYRKGSLTENWFWQLRENSFYIFILQNTVSIHSD